MIDKGVLYDETWQALACHEARSGNAESEGRMLIGPNSWAGDGALALATGRCLVTARIWPVQCKTAAQTGARSGL